MSKREGHFYEFGPFRLVPDERLLLRDGEPVALTPKAFETLVALVRRAGHLADKDELLREVWPDSFVEESNLAQNVFALRKVLGEGKKGQKYIETVPKRGYRFLASVRVVEHSEQELVVHQHVRAEGAGRKGRRTPLPPEGVPASFHASAGSAVKTVAGGDASDAGALEAPTSNGARAATVTLPQTTTAESHSVLRRRKAALIVITSVVLVLAGFGAYLTRLLFSRPDPSPPKTIKLSRLITGTRIWSAAVSPDGRHVAYVVAHHEGASIWLRQVSTTTDLQIIPPERGAEYFGLSFSRDGDYVYYVKYMAGDSYCTLYRVPTLGGPSRKIVTQINSHVTTSPDGKQIAFVSNPPGESVLMIADADGTNGRRLAVRHRPEAGFSETPRGGPSWSPDGKTIATGLISLKGGYHGEVITVSVTDGKETQLTSHRWYQVAQVAWLADGTGLLATAREPSSGAQIWHVSYPEGAVRKVTNDLNDYHGVSLTADSRTLVTVQYDRPSTIGFVPEKPASTSKRRTAGMNEGFYGLSWTPGNKLAYASEAAGNLDIWLMGADGITVEQLTTDPHHDSTPSVSPDGRSLVFISTRDGDIPHVWRMDIDGGNQRRLTNQASEGSPSFTPDARWVVYAVASSGIWKVPSEGGEPVAIYEGDAHSPSVSPDGALVACFYWNQDSKAGRIALLPTGGGPPVKILDMPADFYGLTMRWTADGRALGYVASGNLWKLPLDGGPPRPVTNFNSDLIFNFAWSRDYRQVALARGNIAEHIVLVSNFR